MKHLCHANQCPTITEKKFLMCKNHWLLAPKTLQDAVWKAFKGTTEGERFKSIPYMEACADAVEYIARLEGKNEVNSYRNIAGHLRKRGEKVG